MFKLAIFVLAITAFSYNAFAGSYTEPVELEYASNEDKGCLYYLALQSLNL